MLRSSGDGGEAVVAKAISRRQCFQAAGVQRRRQSAAPGRAQRPGGPAAAGRPQPDPGRRARPESGIPVLQPSGWHSWRGRPSPVLDRLGPPQRGNGLPLSWRSGRRASGSLGGVLHRGPVGSARVGTASRSQGTTIQAGCPQAAPGRSSLWDGRASQRAVSLSVGGRDLGARQPVPACPAATAS